MIACPQHDIIIGLDCSRKRNRQIINGRSSSKRSLSNRSRSLGSHAQRSEIQNLYKPTNFGLSTSNSSSAAPNNTNNLSELSRQSKEMFETISG